MDYDYEKLRDDIIDYLGTAMVAFAPAAMVDIFEAENASNDNLIRIANRYGIDLCKYIINEE